MSILIKNALIVDGGGGAPFTGDVLVDGDRIVKVGETDGKADQVIDAKGLALTPGFIDTHSHSDVQVLLDPHVKPKIRQGITTEVLGQDGVSVAPAPLEYISPWRKNVAGLDGDADEVTWDWIDTAGYFAAIGKKGSATNIAYLVPHGNVRMEVMGLAGREATAEEVGKMCAVLDRELAAGGCGLSSGLIYTPCVYSVTDELVELCKVAAKHKKPFVVHQRSEADDIIESMNEILHIGRESGVRVHFSHFKIAGIKNGRFRPQIDELLDQAAKDGMNLSFDQYPYVAGSTTLGILIPPWAFDGGSDKLLERLIDPECRKRIENEMKTGLPGWDNFWDFAGPDNIYVTSVLTDKNLDLVGKNLIEIGEIRKKSPFDALFDLLYEEKNSVSMYDIYGREEDVIHFLARPEQNVCTDGVYGQKPHPRVYGAFPRILQKYVREEKVLPLETAIHKMTGKAATAFRFDDRGFVKPGLKADLLLFDPATITDNATFLEPVAFPTGFRIIMVNGRIVFADGEETGALPGEVIKV